MRLAFSKGSLGDERTGSHALRLRLLPHLWGQVQKHGVGDRDGRTLQGLRTGHDPTGEFRIGSNSVSMTADVVTLRKADGSTVKVPIDQLSDEDREWIEARRRQWRLEGKIKDVMTIVTPRTFGRAAPLLQRCQVMSQLCRIFHVHLGKNPGLVIVHRLGADREVLGNVLRGFPLRQKLRDFPLAIGQLVPTQLNFGRQRALAAVVPIERHGFVNPLQ